MAIILKTQAAEILIKALRTAIKINSMNTWGIDEDGDFYLNTEEWENKGYLHPLIGVDYLTFSFIGNRAIEMKKDYFAYIQAMFTGMLIQKFGYYFETITTTTAPCKNIDFINL